MRMPDRMLNELNHRYAIRCAMIPKFKIDLMSVGQMKLVGIGVNSLKRIPVQLVRHISIHHGCHSVDLLVVSLFQQLPVTVCVL